MLGAASVSALVCPAFAATTTASLRKRHVEVQIEPTNGRVYAVAHWFSPDQPMLTMHKIRAAVAHVGSLLTCGRRQVKGMKPTETKDVFHAPVDSDQSIWRFMDFARFLSMLERSQLFFPRSSVFEDRFEGSFPRMNKLIRETDLAGMALPVEQIAERLRTRAAFYSWTRHWMLVSCWHMNKYESAGMWKLYSQSQAAVAIRSTYERLRDSLPDEIEIGTVTYIPYDQGDYIEEGNIFFPYVYKRLAFKHEDELRAVIWRPPTPVDLSISPTNRGEGVSIELTKLIEKVVVGPGAPDGFFDLVQRLVQKYYGLPLEVEPSSLDESPYL